MTITRQHFQFIADVIAETMSDRDIDPCVREPVTRLMALKFASALRGTNPAFNRERFLRACGVES